jgi:hypothetical protein
MFGLFRAKPQVDRVAEIEARFPLPPGEYKRLKARRWIFERLPKGGVGAEIGVFRGHFSALICEHLTPQRFYLVDPWTLHGDLYNWGGAYFNHGTLPTAIAREQALARVAAFPAVEAVMVEGFFPACAAQIPEKLDFAYLDASHRFEPTLAELHALSGMMKPGGIIFGDDWWPSTQAPHHAVFRAVQEFLRESDWEVRAAGPAGQYALGRRGDRILG